MVSVEPLRGTQMSTSKRRIAALFAVLGLLLAPLAFASSASAYPAVSVSVTVSTTSPGPGATITVSVKVAPGTIVNWTLHTQTYALGTSTADASGEASLTATLPAGVTGCHTIEADDAATGTVIGSTALSIGGTCSADGTFTPANSSSNNKDSNDLAYTGAAVAGLGGLGLLLLIGGGIMLMTGKRGKATS
jgi:hypothetical protein